MCGLWTLGLAGAEFVGATSAGVVILDLEEKGKNKKQENLTSEQVLVVGVQENYEN